VTGAADFGRAVARVQLAAAAVPKPVRCAGAACVRISEYPLSRMLKSDQRSHLISPLENIYSRKPVRFLK
jgi:hypothetical protein